MNIDISEYKKNKLGDIRDAVPANYALKVDYTYSQNLFCWIFDNEKLIGRIYKTIWLFDDKYLEEFNNLNSKYEVILINKG